MTAHDSQQSVFVVDDESRVCEAIRETLEESGIKVTCFHTAAKCLGQLRKRRCDLLVTDLIMPGMDGMELLTNARLIAPRLRVLMISGYGDIPTAVRAIKAGAVDFIEKPLVKQEFVRQVRRLLEESRRFNEDFPAPVTKQEMRVLQLIVGGHSNKEIAGLLHRSVRTIEVHRSRIMHKLDVENLIDLLKRAAELGLVDLPAKRRSERV